MSFFHSFYRHKNLSLSLFLLSMDTFLLRVSCPINCLHLRQWHCHASFFYYTKSSMHPTKYNDVCMGNVMSWVAGKLASYSDWMCCTSMQALSMAVEIDY